MTMPLTYRKYINIILSLTLSSLIVGCKPTPKDNNDHSKMDHSTMDHSKMDHSKMDHSQHEAMDAGEPSDQSIFNLESTWTSQDSEKIQLKSLGGKVQLFAMIYSSCQNACPRIIADMKKIEDSVNKKYKDKVHLVLVSIDPKVDTPEKLKELANSSHLSSNWKLLRGEEDDVLELAALLGVKYKKISDTDYAHSNIISVLNPKGEIVHQQMGLGVSPEQSIEAIDKLL